MDTLGKKLFKLRTDTNMQKEDLAELLDVTIDDIDNWEKSLSEPSIKQIKKLALIYHISIDFLLKDYDDNCIKNKNLVEADESYQKVLFCTCSLCNSDIYEGEKIHTIELEPGHKEVICDHCLTEYNFNAIKTEIARNPIQSSSRCSSNYPVTENSRQENTSCSSILNNGINKDDFSNDGSFGGGFILGAILGIIGVIIAISGGKNNTKNGSWFGFAISIIIFLILYMFFSI